MKTEELEDLAGGRNPNFIQGMDWEEIIVYLARKVIAADKLVEALCEPVVTHSSKEWLKMRQESISEYEATK